jgi:quinol monooxygenase YgiN
MLVVTGVIYVGKESREDFIKHATEMAKATREESGCHAYNFYQAIDDDSCFRIYEEWDDEAALAAHFETEHMAKYRSMVGNIDIKSMNIVKFESGERVRIR